ncbi:MAG: NAD-dependent epimerase/dehydratase family protein [Armatimonadota bacterium]
MKITVTGASGFIGRRLCEAFIKNGHQVSALVRNPQSASELKQMGASVHIGKITDKELLIGACFGADIVYNAAGILGKWMTSSEELELVNTYAAGLVVRCAAEAGAKKAVHISTAGVSGPIPADTVGTETNPIAPLTEYQRTKLEGERAAIATYMETGIPLVIVRPAFVYGPGDLHKLSLFKMVAAKKMILVDGGTSRLHPVYIDDVLSGLFLAGTRGTGNGDIYIIAGNQPVTTKDLIGTIAKTLTVQAPSCSIPSALLIPVAMITELAGMALHKEPILTRSKVKLLSESYAYSIDKARNNLGYEPKVGLSEGIKRTCEWYIHHNYLHPGRINK